jgi:hypothetical protein
MAEPNPYRTPARVFAFASYLFAGLLLIIGVLSMLAAALSDLSKLPLGGISNRAAAFLAAGPYVVVAILIVLLGWRVQNLYGQPFRRDKLAARSAVGCLQLGGLGCGLWTVLSVATMLLTDNVILKMVSPDAPVGVKGVLIASSGLFLIMAILLAVAWFISVNFVRLKPEERRQALQAYVNYIGANAHRSYDPHVREDMRRRTVEALSKLDTPQKATLLSSLSESGLLTGNARIRLDHTDFRDVDLRSVNLPYADLRQINLERASLQGAMLFKVNLQKARLKDADLSRANLQGADLRQAVLTGAVLENTNLADADLTGALVTENQLKRARLKHTTKQDGTIGN